MRSRGVGHMRWVGPAGTRARGVARGRKMWVMKNDPYPRARPARPEPVEVRWTSRRGGLPAVTPILSRLLSPRL